MTPSRAALLALVVIALLVLAGDLLEESSDPLPPERPELRAPEMVGCYRVRADGWRAASPADTPEGPIPEGFRPPEEVLLLPDTLDAWGRPLDARRASELGAGGDGPDAGGTGRSLRWLVRRDTLWLLWSEEEVRAGAALFAAGDTLVGRVRATRGSDSTDATARAAAWRINCATRLREEESGRRR